jgi:GTPase
VLGYDGEGRVLNYVGVATPTPADICASASRVLNFLDMGGHEKYLKTTLYGMTCLLPGGCGLCLCCVVLLACDSKQPCP